MTSLPRCNNVSHHTHS